MRLFLCLFILLPLFSTAQTGWDAFVSIDGRFRVKVPDPLQLQEDTLETEIGSIPQMTFYGQSESGNLVFVINCFDYPEATVHSDSSDLLQELFTASMEEAVTSVAGELRYEEDWQYADYPGKFWRIDYLDGQASLKTRVFVAGSRFYSIQVASPSDVKYAEDSLKFLDSFELLE